MSLQNVRKKDNNLLFNWRNEKSVVKNSISRKKVNYKNHKIWFQKRMSIEPILFWILKKNNSSVGTIRLDKKKRSYFLSYLIDKNFRNRGFGSIIIEKMLKKKTVKNILKKNFQIFAIVKKENKNSIKAILSNNFYKVYKNEKIYKLKYENKK